MMDKACVSDALQLTGRIILENGGGAFRVEDTVERLALALGLSRIEVYSVPGSVIMTLGYQDGTTETQVVRCIKRTVHLEKVDRVNRISRDVAGGRMTPSEALCQLKQIDSVPDALSLRTTLIATALSAGGLALMFRGSFWDATAASLTALTVRLLIVFLKRRDHHEQVIVHLLGGALTTLLPRLTGLLFAIPTSDAAVAGALMQLLPGLAMTTAVQDLLKGDITSGLGNATQAMLTALLVAGGAMVAGRLMLLF